MRALTIGFVALGVVAGACNRADSAVSAANDPNATTSPAATPVATSGAGDAARPAAALPAQVTANSAPAAATAAAPAWRDVTLPAGTTMSVVLDTGVGSDTSRVEQPVQAHLSRPIVIRGETVVAQGSAVSGVVTNATRSGKVKGLAHVAVRFDTLTPRGVDERYRIRTSAVGRTAPATKKKDAVEIGAPAAGGAIIGAIVGGKKGAAIGTAAGGGAGTAVVLSTRGKEVHLPKGSVVTVRLTQPLTVRVRS
jgi:hypothetical protein